MKKHAFTAVQHDGAWRVVRVDAGEPGYTVVSGPCYDDEGAARARATYRNRKMGLSDSAAAALVQEARRLQNDEPPAGR